MKPTMAQIFIAENQYSTVPKVLTLKALTVIRIPENPSIHSHPGTSGNQNFMYRATALDLGAHREHDAGPIGVAHQEACEWADVALSICAE